MLGPNDRRAAFVEDSYPAMNVRGTFVCLVGELVEGNGTGKETSSQGVLLSQATKATLLSHDFQLDATQIR